MKNAFAIVWALALSAAAARPAEARVVRLVVEQTRPYADGKTYGVVGAFERLDGTVYMEVDPRDPLNAGIVNLDKAPRNAKGLVEFSSQFYIIKPVDMARGNHKISYPPLTYAVTTDPISGVRDGILKRPTTDPLVIHVDSGNELWQMNGSLNVHDGHGNPVPVPDTVRLYFTASHGHVGAAGVGVRPTEKGPCEYPTNGNFSHNTVFRALLVALDEWADRGIAPPPSQYPDVRNGTLVTIEEVAKSFPAIAGVRFPTVMNELSLLNFGPKFSSTGGWLSHLPPTQGPRYRVLVAKTDKDGLELGGIRTPDIAVPVGTNLSWNLRATGPRQTDLCSSRGGFIPFAKTKVEQLERGDPRLSLEERYKDHAAFVKAVEDAAHRQVADRFLLKEDAKTVIATAEASDILR